MISDTVLTGVIERLRAMTPTFHAPADGLGIFLGDGIPRTAGAPLRSGLLLQLLEELQQRRKSDELHNADLVYWGTKI